MNEQSARPDDDSHERREAIEAADATGMVAQQDALHVTTVETDADGETTLTEADV